MKDYLGTIGTSKYNYKQEIKISGDYVGPGVIRQLYGGMIFNGKNA